MFDLFKRLLEKYDEGDGSEIALNIIFNSYISPDNLISVEDFKKSREVLLKFKDAIKVADIGLKTKRDWLIKIEDGLKILDRGALEL